MTAAQDNALHEIERSQTVIGAMSVGFVQPESALCRDNPFGLPVCSEEDCPKASPDGWWIEALPIDWPDTSLLLGGPWGSIYDGVTQFAKLDVVQELRAFGFSETGKSLVIATSSDVTIFALQS